MPKQIDLSVCKYLLNICIYIFFFQLFFYNISSSANNEKNWSFLYFYHVFSSILSVFTVVFSQFCPIFLINFHDFPKTPQSVVCKLNVIGGSNVNCCLCCCCINKLNFLLTKSLSIEQWRRRQTFQRNSLTPFKLHPFSKDLEITKIVQRMLENLLICHWKRPSTSLSCDLSRGRNPPDGHNMMAVYDDVQRTWPKYLLPIILDISKPQTQE